MKKITSKDIETLYSLYFNGDYNSFKVVWKKLMEALEWIDKHSVLVIDKFESTEKRKIEKREQLLDWVKETFPEIFFELKRGELSLLNDNQEFPKFRQTEITIDSISTLKDFKQIKEITIWGDKIKLKQTYQKIEKLELGEDFKTIRIRLSKNAYLLIINEGIILNSSFNLIFKNASFIEFGYMEMKRTFELNTENSVKTLDSFLDISSIYLNALEIKK